MLFTRSHLDQREMTSLEEMRCCHSAPLSVIHIHLASLLSFPAGLGGSDSSSWRILSVKLWLHCLVPASHHSTCEIDDDSSPLDVAPKKSFIEPIHSYVHTDREIQRHTKTNKQNHSPLLPPAQPHSSTVSSQRDCTHSNKQRRRLLSKCNYLVLSISLTAVGQRALCWWG